MKILYHHRIGSRDGQSVHLEEIVSALRAQGHQVILVGPKSFASAQLGQSSRVIDSLKRFVPKMLYELLELGYNIPAYFRLRRAFFSDRPDFIYERYNLYLLAGVWLARKTLCPIILEVNAPLARERLVYGGLGLAWLATRLEQWVWKSADFVLPVTNVLAEYIRDAGVDERRIRVVPNAVNPSHFAQHMSLEVAKSRLNLTGKFVIGFTGFMRDWHGLDLVVRWLGRRKKADNVHLLLVGDGPVLVPLKALVVDLHLEDHVTFTGLVERQSVSEIMCSFDVALQPRCVDYASPLKMLEYMALGKAIVAPDQPNIRELLTHRESGLLFDPSDPQSMASMITELLCDDLLRKRIGAEARLILEKHKMKWSDNADRIVKLAGIASDEKGRNCV